MSKLFVSILIPGPIVDETDIFLIYVPLTTDGFVLIINDTKAFKFSTKWTKVPFLWFLNYMDTKDENYSYEKINKQKIAACTPEVRKIIFG